jgi:hypothetical protein
MRTGRLWGKWTLAPYLARRVLPRPTEAFERAVALGLQDPGRIVGGEWETQGPGQVAMLGIGREQPPEFLRARHNGGVYVNRFWTRIDTTIEEWINSQVFVLSNAEDALAYLLFRMARGDRVYGGYTRRRFKRLHNNVEVIEGDRRPKGFESAAVVAQILTQTGNGVNRREVTGIEAWYVIENGVLIGLALFSSVGRLGWEQLVALATAETERVGELSGSSGPAVGGHPADDLT